MLNKLPKTKKKRHSILSLCLFFTTAIGAIQFSIEADADDSEYTKILAWPPVAATGQEAKRIQHGEYMAKAADCIACHTNSPQDGAVFAGGLPMQTPFGTFYTPNITPDKETGIGKWTEDEFVNFMQKGIMPDGSNAFPVFPYLWYTKMTRQDILDIKAYLERIPAVKQPNRKNDVPFPFNVRFGQTFWKILFFNAHKGEFRADPAQSAEWNRGAYLVQGPGHCGQCHTPINFLGGPKREYDLTGGFLNNFLAPNITSSNLGKARIDEIVSVFQKDQMVGGGPVQGPMLEVNHNSLRYLSPQDLQSIAVYLQSVKSKQPPMPSVSGTGTAAGKKIYESTCFGCHSTGAGGAPKLGDAAGWASVLKQNVDETYKKAINGIGGMPAKGTCMSCSDEQIKAAVNYMLDEAKKGSGESAPAAPGAGIKPLTVADGKNIYVQYCSICHDSGHLNAPRLGDKAAWAPRLKQGLDVLYAHALQGQEDMPARGTCSHCNDAEILAAVKYMAQQSKTAGDYNLW